MSKPPAFGPKSTVWLAEVGIHRVEDLAGRDMVAIYLAVKARRPRDATLNLLWALAGWTLGCPWSDLPPDLKAQLRADVEARTRRSRPDQSRGGAHEPVHQVKVVESGVPPQI